MTSNKLRETGFCAKCGYGKTHCDLTSWHKYTQSFAAPDVQALLKEKDAEIENCEFAIRNRDIQITDLTAVRKARDAEIDELKNGTFGICSYEHALEKEAREIERLKIKLVEANKGLENKNKEILQIRASVARMIRAGDLQVEKISEQFKEIQRLKRKPEYSEVSRKVLVKELSKIEKRDVKLADDLEALFDGFLTEGKSISGSEIMKIVVLLRGEKK